MPERGIEGPKQPDSPHQKELDASVDAAISALQAFWLNSGQTLLGLRMAATAAALDVREKKIAEPKQTTP